MIVYTGHVSYQDGDRLDISMKSDTAASRILAPTWAMVLGVKAGQGTQRWPENAISPNPIPETEYTERYYRLLWLRYRETPEQFIDLLRHDQITLCCQCVSGMFCHRHLAVDILETIALAEGLPFIRGGERN